MSNTFDKTGVAAALTAGNLKTLVKSAIKRAKNRTSLDSAEADLVEAKEYLELFQERANSETINTVADLGEEIAELQELIEQNREEAEVQ